MSELKVEAMRREGDSLILTIHIPQGVAPASVEDAFLHGPLANKLVQHAKSICRLPDGTVQLRCFPSYPTHGDVEEKKDRLDSLVAYELGFQLRNYATT